MTHETTTVNDWRTVGDCALAVGCHHSNVGRYLNKHPDIQSRTEGRRRMVDFTAFEERYRVDYSRRTMSGEESGLRVPTRAPSSPAPGVGPVAGEARGEGGDRKSVV